MKIEHVRIANIQQSDIRHSSLSSALEARIRVVAKAVAEVYPLTHAEWLDGFERDAHPEREISVWEVIAIAYSAFTTERTMDIETRKETLVLALDRSCGHSAERILQQPCKLLTVSDRKQFLAHFSAAASSLGLLNKFT